MTEPRIHHIGSCVVRIWPAYLETVFEDGLKVPAAANYDEQSLATAAALGYGTDTWALSRDHELAHSLLMTAIGYQHSLVLRGVALRAAGGRKEDYVTPVQSAWEEGLVIGFQEYVQTGRTSTRFATYRETLGLDWDGLADRLREMTSV